MRGEGRLSSSFDHPIIITSIKISTPYISMIFTSTGFGSAYVRLQIWTTNYSHRHIAVSSAATDPLHNTCQQVVALMDVWGCVALSCAPPATACSRFNCILLEINSIVLSAPFLIWRSSLEHPGLANSLMHLKHLKVGNVYHHRGCPFQIPTSWSSFYFFFKITTSPFTNLAARVRRGNISR